MTRTDNYSFRTDEGISIVTLITVLFVILKLTGVISWHWIWVLAPLWSYMSLFVAIYVIFMALVAVYIGYLLVTKIIKKT